MSATADTVVLRPDERTLARADGIELLERNLVRRPDGQMVQLGPLMYALLEAIDGRRSVAQLADALCERIGRPCDEEVIGGLADKLAAQGLLAGTEANAPERRSPLLALRAKVLVTNPVWTRRLTRPFTFLFQPWIVAPVALAFVAVCWFVLFRKGLAAPTADAFRNPELLLLVFALAVASAGFHELGHASACCYGGATPGGMGMGLYLVWPAFYTDVTDAYRLPRRDRLRVDLGGVYFNAIVAVAVTAVWLAVRSDALLLLVGLQLLMMVKNVSPVIRSDGYHIVSDLTGVPDLYAHIGPTLKRRETGLSRRARWLVLAWILVTVPVLLALALGAVLLLPRLLTSAWDSGRVLVASLGDRGVIGTGAALLQLLALALPAAGSLLIAQKLGRLAIVKGRDWSGGRPVRRGAVVLAYSAIAAGLAFAWWPQGQYQPVPPQGGTLIGLGRVVADPVSYVRPAPAVSLAPGKYLAISMVPRDRSQPALYVIPAKHIALVGSGDAAKVIPFDLPAPPGPGDTQALAVNTADGSVVYDVAYGLITVSDGAPVTNKNSAFALASCNACSTVAVSFQVVLVVGHSNIAAPINAAGALNYKCPSCVTAALATQIVVTLKSQPTAELVSKLQAALQELDAVRYLGSLQEIEATVTDVKNQIDAALRESGQVDQQTTTAQRTTTTSTTPTAATTATTTQSTTTAQTTTTQATTTTTQSTTTGTAPTTPTTTTESTTTTTTTTSP